MAPDVYRRAPPWARPILTPRIVDMRTADRGALFREVYAAFLLRREEARDFGQDFNEPPPVPLPGPATAVWM